MLDTIDARLADLEGTERRREQTTDYFDRLGGNPVARRVSGADNETMEQFRSGILERNPRPIDVHDPSPRSYYQPGLERRDLVKTSPANMQPVSFHKSIVEHLVETSAVLAAGATLISTTSGEDMRIPRSTALSTATLTAEAAAIAESDPTLGSYTMGAYKYAVLIQVSREMAEDSSIDLQGYLARETGVALGNALGAHLINGTGSGQPRGVLVDSTAGTTGPTGTATTLGSQQTSGQGTDLLNSLVGSLAEPYTRSPAAGFLLRTASLTTIRNLKASTGELVGNSYLASSPYPFLVDPNVPAMSANAKSILFGDWSRYFVRMVNGIRFDRSDDYAFNQDLITYRATMRADGALIDTTGSIKHFANSAT
jgi:HK97 family phage major capsid protein